MTEVLLQIEQTAAGEVVLFHAQAMPRPVHPKFRAIQATPVPLGFVPIHVHVLVITRKTAAERLRVGCTDL